MEQTAETYTSAGETDDLTETTEPGDGSSGHETSESVVPADHSDDPSETIHGEFPDNSKYLSFIGFSEKNKRNECIKKYFSDESDYSAEEKSSFFREDMTGERLTPKIIRGMSTKEEKIKALKYIQDAYLLILIKEYLYAKDTMRGAYYKLEFENAEAELRYLLNLMTQNSNDKYKNEGDNKELTDFLNRNFWKIGVKEIQDMINNYYKKMKYNKQFEAKEKKLLYLNRSSKNGQ